MQGVQFQKVQTVIRVPILPSELNSIIEGIYRYLNGYIGEYMKAFKGLVICYTENIGITDDVGYIMGLDPKVYIKTSVEFVIMKIVVGGEITGYITSTEEGHAEMKTHGIVTARLEGEPVQAAPGLYKCTISGVNLYPFYVYGKSVHAQYE